MHNPLSPNLGFLDAPAVAVGPSGAAVVAWHTVKPGPHTTLHAAARAEGGEEFAALTDVAQFDGVRSSIKLAASPEGRVTLAWTFWDDATDRYVLQSASRGRTGDFGGVETVDTFTTGGGYIALDTGPDGTSALMWHDLQTRYAVRPEGGGFGAPRTVPGSTSGYYVPELRYSADGSARAVWRGYRLGRPNVESARIHADGTSGSAEQIAVPTTQPDMVDVFDGLFGLALDPRGNAAVSWSHFADVAPGPATDHRRALEVRIFDGEPPNLRRVTVPPTAITGVGVPMSAVANDPLTPVTVRWKLGKFLTAQGAMIAPTYDEPGDHVVGIEAVDAAGNVTATSRTIQRDAKPEPVPARAGLRLTPTGRRRPATARCRAAGRGCGRACPARPPRPAPGCPCRRRRARSAWRTGTCRSSGRWPRPRSGRRRTRTRRCGRGSRRRDRGRGRTTRAPRSRGPRASAGRRCRRP